MSAEKEANKKLLKWQRHGHIDINEDKRMKTKERVIGINFPANLDRLNCEICAK